MSQPPSLNNRPLKESDSNMSRPPSLNNPAIRKLTAELNKLKEEKARIQSQYKEVKDDNKNIRARVAEGLAEFQRFEENYGKLEEAYEKVKQENNTLKANNGDEKYLQLESKYNKVKQEREQFEAKFKDVQSRLLHCLAESEKLESKKNQYKQKVTKLQAELDKAKETTEKPNGQKLFDEIEQLKAENTKLKEENEKIKTCSIAAQVAKLQEEVDTGEETIEKINEQKLSDEVEQLKAENTKLKEVNEKIEACSIAAQERAQTLKDAYEKIGGTHYHIQQRLWELQDSYNELKDRYNKMRDRHSINDEDDEDANNMNNGTNHDDDDDEYSLNVAPKTLYFKCPYPSCMCDEKRPLTLKKDDYEAAYRVAYENKLLLGNVGSDLFDLSSQKKADEIRTFAKAYGKTNTALPDGIKFLRDHYLECHIGQNYPPLVIRDKLPDNIKKFYEGELAKQPFKKDPEVNYQQFQSTWHETKKGKVKPHHNINGEVYKELLTKALHSNEHKKIVIRMARNFWKHEGKSIVEIE
jgi:predicted  nucleic acid-binding Zn-ribbon protein